MKVLVISKPIYTYIMSLAEFPSDGDTFNINSSIETLSNLGSVIACTLGKYGIDTSFTGLIGEDIYKDKITKIFDSYKVEHKYLEVNYTEPTLRSFQIYNQKTNRFTKINEMGSKNCLTKYKYEFIPDIIIMDDKDYNANLASLNNFTNSKSIFVGEKFSSESNIYCNKCNYVICSLSFASEITGIYNNLNKPKTIIAMFQKYIDLYPSNLIIKLDNFDCLYCVNDEVRLIKNQNNNLSNKEYVYYSVLSYFLINNEIEMAIKNTNKIMINSKNELDILKNIPDYSNIIQLSNQVETNNNISNIPNDNSKISQNIVQDKMISNNVNNNIQEKNQNNNLKGINDEKNI